MGNESPGEKKKKAEKEENHHRYYFFSSPNGCTARFQLEVKTGCCVRQLANFGVCPALLYLFQCSGFLNEIILYSSFFKAV